MYTSRATCKKDDLDPATTPVVDELECMYAGTALSHIKAGMYDRAHMQHNCKRVDVQYTVHTLVHYSVRALAPRTAVLPVDSRCMSTARTTSRAG